MNQQTEHRGAGLNSLESLGLNLSDWTLEARISQLDSWWLELADWNPCEWTQQTGALRDGIT